MTNEELELAAVSAVSWQELTESRCEFCWFSGSIASPAPASLGLTYWDDWHEERVFARDHELEGIFPGYDRAIDEGRGDEVALAFRSAKRGVLFAE